ncbi:MAG: hypothetical protein FWG26_03920 [Betaproteobacteria bacterium]|nr:hypothetical protein [Betaproteobacteria bacterium]
MNESDPTDLVIAPPRTSVLKKLGIGTLFVGTSVPSGLAATAIGLSAAGSSTTAAISAVGAAVGGTVGGVVGTGVGLATGGMGIAATVPFAVGGAAIGGWVGPALALFGIGTAPAWAVPVAIGGGVLAGSGVTVGVLKFFKYIKSKRSSD